mgnify:CR=1 FL=1
MYNVIKNFDALAVTANRKDAMSIIEAGYRAVDTTHVVNESIFLENNILSIKGEKFDISLYNKVFLIGFGKASCQAVRAIENILGSNLAGGIVIDKDPSICKIVDVYRGTHPFPSKENVEATQKIVDLAQKLKDDDLVIVVVSGGGSALLCWPMSEYEQGGELYKAFLHTGGTIGELNVLRKHLSEIKGGGLAKLLYPATVVSLIFCDVPGGHFENTASGPTYLDKTTIKDAENLLTKYSIKNTFSFNETPKDNIYFEKVTNIPFVSNNEALEAMKKMAETLGYEVISLGSEVYDAPNNMLSKMITELKPNSIVLACGELAISLKKSGGVGGRNLYTSGQSINVISDSDVFIAFASDGIDNLSVSAGAIVDIETKKKIKELNINLEEYLRQDMGDKLFMELGDNIITGPTGSNVSDFYLMLRK